MEGGLGGAKITIGITGLHEILVRDYGVEDPFGAALNRTFCFLRSIVLVNL